eukprot:8542148-Alexandrium_andersonii.AAC.1
MDLSINRADGELAALGGLRAGEAPRHGANVRQGAGELQRLDGPVLVVEPVVEGKLDGAALLGHAGEGWVVSQQARHGLLQ